MHYTKKSSCYGVHLKMNFKKKREGRKEGKKEEKENLGFNLRKVGLRREGK